MFKSFLDSVQELVFPSCCLHCEKQLPLRDLPLFCDDCLSMINPITAPQCLCCGSPFQAGQDHLCGLCVKNHYHFDLARAAVRYKEPVPSLVSTLKFKGELTGLATLAHLARHCSGIHDLSEPDMILPVPLHKRRLRERLFNQSTLIAQACFPENKNMIFSDVLERLRHTEPQTGLSGKDRRRNLSRAFCLRGSKSIKNKNILLVDDVFTTGSTVNECAKVLRKAGAKRIEVFTVARVI